jgi:hypothetical protein
LGRVNGLDGLFAFLVNLTPIAMDNKYLKPLILVVILGLGIYIAVSPNIVYAPAPRIVLFFILSIVPAILFGSEIASRFEVSLPGFAFTVVGAGAVFFGSLFLLDRFSKPEEKIAVFSFYDENGNPLAIDAPGMIRISLGETGLSVTDVYKGNNLIVIFPEQVSEVHVDVYPVADEKPYHGVLTYAGTRKSRLSLGTDLTRQ